MTSDGPSRQEDVRRFFDDADQYLRYGFRIRLRCEIVRDLLERVAWTRLLDIGCGDGSVSLQLLRPDVSLTLLDMSERMLASARARVPAGAASSVRLEQGDLLTFESGATFDAVLCLGVLAHVASVEAAIAKIASLLAPGGHAVIQITDADTWVAATDAAYDALRRRFVDRRGYRLNPCTADGLLHLLRRHRLEPLQSRRYSLLLPGMGRLPDRWLYRWQRTTLTTGWLSRHGSELILLVGKPGGA